VGSEGTLALVTEITAKLQKSPKPKNALAIFETVDDATESVTEMTARAITPAACEMDGWLDALRCGKITFTPVSARLRRHIADRNRGNPRGGRGQCAAI